MDNNAVTKNEFAHIVGMLKTAYPNKNFLNDEASLNFWYIGLCEFELEILINAIQEWCFSNVYPPSISEIRLLCLERKGLTLYSSEEAWAIVSNCIRTYGRTGFKEAFKHMDKLTKKIVDKMGWSNLSTSEKPANDFKQFKALYDKEYKKYYVELMTPQKVLEDKKKLINKYNATIATITKND